MKLLTEILDYMAGKVFYCRWKLIFLVFLDYNGLCEIKATIYFDYAFIFLKKSFIHF